MGAGNQDRLAPGRRLRHSPTHPWGDGLLKRAVAIAATAALAGTIPYLSSTVGASAAPVTPVKSEDRAGPAGPFALAGDKASQLRLPADVVRVGRMRLPDGSVSTRYQQMVGSAAVLNGQITVIRGADGSRAAVIGAYYPGLLPRNTTEVSKAQAVAAAVRRHGPRGSETTDLRIDPRNGQFFRFSRHECG